MRGVCLCKVSTCERHLLVSGTTYERCLLMGGDSVWEVST